MIEWALIGSRRGRLLGGFRAAIAAVAATLTGLYLFAGLHFVGHPGILPADTTGSRLYATVYATAVVYGTGQVVRVAGDPARRRTDTVGVYTMFGVAGVFGISYGVGIFVCGLIAVRPEWITGWTWSTAGPAALCLAIAASLGWYAPSEPFRQALIRRCRARRRTELRFDIVPNPAPTGFHITLGPQLVSTEPTAPDQVRTVPESTEGPQDRAPEPAQAHRGH